MVLCVYILAAFDDADDFPVSENRGKQTVRSLSLILLLYNFHIEEEFCKSNGTMGIFKENSLRDNLTDALLRSIQKVEDLVLT